MLLKLYRKTLFLLLITGAFITGCGTFSGSDENLWPIRENGLYGFINNTGEVVIAPQFAYAFRFSEGLAAVNVGGTETTYDIPKDGKWGFIDRSGRYVINPKYYSPPNDGKPYDLNDLAKVLHEGYVFSEGKAAVYSDNGWIYIDSAENIVVNDPRIKSARQFTEGLAAVYINGKWGYIDHSYKTAQDSMAIEPAYLYPVDFLNGHILTMDKDSRWVVIDRTGKRKLPQYRIESNFFEGIAIVQDSFKMGEIHFASEYKYGLVDTDGRFLFAPQFDQVGRYGSGLCPALVGSKVGEQTAFVDQVRIDNNIGGKWGFVNLRGEFVINPLYEDAKGFSEGIAAIKMGGLWGYMAEDGSMITGFEFRWVGYFKEGIARVKLGPIHNDYDYHYAYINNEGDVLWVQP
ncbi:MAG: WG repeat-containing protein [Bacteroidia bacterium]|nr:WG repeat-containing protein [Bacteroidia bacterium]